jgi:hypothetical protein
MKNILFALVLSLLWGGIVFAKERFIPLELFTGGDIRNDSEIRFTQANKVFGKKSRKKIAGPIDWKNPETGKTIQVYERTRKGQSELKKQLFTITNNNQCIGRVWDSRGRGRVIVNGCKFPIGVWKKGETRTFKGSSGDKPRIIKLKILKLGKNPKSKIKFNWKLYNGSGKLMDDNDYTFSPKKVMTVLIDR